ncbi:high-affinity nicotinic acid transporter [Coprinopsis cinerea okayama7|uniref:High-affinity nicotinic acid transporter n=1 Tax=Coprinopsis cinerea (strain Okayama-7 / 130 / ATCC MYA-4618 / FGSC 9003) TaxID=240176 RepID=A8P0C5_COPC7|nr:high-affinity nicotinic acid transporter [Coprinopsis cinerea okayama7\|eukprot:XP_001837858.2 high-affinity nicotinic acid transporter [Coprinopsis cinerea okayama7\
MSESKRSSDLKVEDIEKREHAATPEVDAHYDPKFIKRTLSDLNVFSRRRVDWRLLPIMGLLYAVALIDRTNLGIARTAGMEEDLQLYVGERYSIASMIYFVPYTILQIPGNIALRYLGARLHLTICVVGWGAAQLGMGFVTDWVQLCICRVLLGVFEAGFFPALVYIITTWYKRHEVQKRLALFYIVSIITGGFSPILAYVFTLLKGTHGYNGWQWIFIIEGAATIGLGVLAWLFAADFPETSRFVNEEERKMILDRVEADRKDSVPDEVTLPKVLKHMSDPIAWSCGLMFLSSTMPAYAVGFFITPILFSMGYTMAEALLLSAPPAGAAMFSTFFFAWLADKTRKRAIWLACQNLIVITGLMVTGYTNSNATRYFGLFLVNMGASGCVPGVLAYQSNNVTSHSKRAVTTAITIAMGGIGGIFATTVWRQKDFPRYIPGIWATMACQFTMLILLGVNSIIFLRRNKLRREGKCGPLENTEGFYYTL